MRPWLYGRDFRLVEALKMFNVWMNCCIFKIDSLSFLYENLIKVLTFKIIIIQLLLYAVIAIFTSNFF